MDMGNGSSDFAALIADALRAELTEVNGTLRFDLGRQGFPEPFVLQLERLDQIVDRLRRLGEHDETALFDERYYEVLVREEGGRFHHLLRMRDDEYNCRDDDNQLTYTLSSPSDEYVLFLLGKLSRIGPLRYAFLSPSFRFRPSGTEDLPSVDLNVMEFLKQSLRRLLTLRIDSDRNRSPADLVRLADGFVFQISYNLDQALVPARYFDDLARRGRITRHRRGRLEELDPPRLSYSPDLIYHYQLAVSSESPPLEYLSYYHVAEHFFEAVFQDDLIQRVRNTLTQPDFSYRRKRDITKLISVISRALRFRGEDVVFSEEEALRLTLARYVNIEELHEKICEYDESLIDYLKSNEVGFSGGDQVSLDGGDEPDVYGAMARRIYKTRNAIVHSKEGARGKYVPFQHDRVLAKEVPLLRFIAELIIIGSSSQISQYNPQIAERDT